MPNLTRDVVIIGAGISGICTAIDLIRKNGTRNFVILEKSSQIGGTWNHNKYPGCCCDVWSHLYSFSFEQNPDWTREYPGQEEILEYLIKVVQKWNLYRHIVFNVSVEDATWQDDEKAWDTKVRNVGSKEADHYIVRSPFLVSAVGQLNIPHYPLIPGLDTFSGKKMHSACWDKTYPLEGKRVGIIGNGATAAQIIPAIVDSVSSLVVFQRQPNWILPRAGKAISPLKRALYRYLPPLRKYYRATLMDYRESAFNAIVEPDSDMATVYRDLGTAAIQQNFPSDPEMRSKLTPTYPIGCKRVIISDDFYPALAQPHVTLETLPISQITAGGIAVGTGPESEKTHDFDLIILATGFQATEFLYPINVTGRNGRKLADLWDGGARAYNGVLGADLPNFAMLYGPNTNLGHNSIILMIEAQAAYITALVSRVVKAREGPDGTKLSLVVRGDKLREYDEEVQRRLANSSFADPRCMSWYKNREGRITNNWCGTVVEYQKLLSEVVWADFQVEGPGLKLKPHGGYEKSNEKSIDGEAWGVTKLGRVVEESSVGLKEVLQVGSVVTAGALAVGLAGRYYMQRRC